MLITEKLIQLADEIFAYSDVFNEEEYDYVIDAIMEIQEERLQ